MDLQYSTDSFGTRDWSWIANRMGVAEAAQTLTVSIAGMVESKHYPEGFIKPGILLAKYSSGGSSGLWAPYVHDGATGLNDAKAIVLDGGHVRQVNGVNVATRVTVSAILEGWPLHIFLSKLPNLLAADGTTNRVVVAADLPSGFVDVGAVIA